MKSKRIINIFIFTLAVIAVLLRPFVFYYLTEKQDLAKDPVALNSLLQKLVKKKDDRHFLNPGELGAIQCTEEKIPPPFSPVIIKKKRQPFIHPAFNVYYHKQLNTIFMVCPQPKYHCLLSKFQI
jgi:hypothetical protein